ncbi:cation-transporting P-type ATPase [Mycoplasma nasistruthionis]|uniref:Cation-transporting P-type ATPase N-terminal domain-containing protein n=1 Tax=Mycoplasma nasistruthionis TaxID=353852 RepID=A0A4Y6I603_9MOLU|nr:hypothetical protein FIV53_00075 [Mycoplasma nasistruthionis]
MHTDIDSNFLKTGLSSSQVLKNQKHFGLNKIESKNVKAFFWFI